MKIPVFSLLVAPLQVLWRSQEIARTISIHGMAVPLANMGWAIGKNGLSWVRGSSASLKWDEVLAKDLARLFVELGPTFIKLGQMLANRPDWVGEKAAEQLKRLFDRVPEVPFRRIEKVLREELGEAKVRKFFRHIDRTTLGSASLAQTHVATLHDGSRVIVKIQKPGVERTVRTDLILLEGWARSAHLAFPHLDILNAFREFKAETERELNYELEAANIDRFRRNYRRFFSDSAVTFPKYYPELSNRRVLTLEPMRGKKMLDLVPGSPEAKRAAEKSVEAILEQIFDHGFFHGDPHQANVFYIEEEGRVGFIDLGLVGRLGPVDKRKFLQVLLAVLKRDKEKLSRALYDLGEPGVRTNYGEFEKEIQSLLNEVKTQGLRSVSLEGLLNRLLKTARKHHIFIPNRYVLMMRSCLLIEGAARQLHPQFSLMEVAVPIVSKSLLKAYNPLRRIWSR